MDKGRQLPDFSYESEIWDKGYRFIAGCDEVGRGSLAGPIVAGCVGFSSEVNVPDKILINDSKKLTQKERESACIWIKRTAIFWAVGDASVAQINRLGIVKAANIAFRKAIINANKRLALTGQGAEIQHLLIDAFYIPYVRGLSQRLQKPIIKGDTKSVSIAAASILAKVYRDRILTALGKEPQFRKFDWENNKGYGTKVHKEAIAKHGLTKHHRKKFVESLLKSTIKLSD